MNDPFYTIPAVVTVQNGKAFKSKLEAQWAEFFTDIKIPWQYEPRTFTLPKIGVYTPDFLLDNYGVPLWVEVKPKGYYYRDVRGLMDKPQSLCQHAKQDVVMLDIDDVNDAIYESFTLFRHTETTVDGDGNDAGWFGRAKAGFPNVMWGKQFEFRWPRSDQPWQLLEVRPPRDPDDWCP